MLRTLGLGIALSAFLLLAGSQALLSQQARKVTVKVQLPQEDAKVTIDDKATSAKGLDRKIAYAVPAGKDSIKVTATWEPNGYTKISRTIKLSVKDKTEITANLSKAVPGSPDDITVIFVPTPDDIVEEMARLGSVTKKDVVFDLGCGDGRIVITAVKKFGAKRGVGVDLDPERVKESKENAKNAGIEPERLEFRQGDVLKIDDLKDADVVMLYMGDFINLRLRPILKKTLKPGARIVSHRFKMGDWEPTKTVTVKGKNGYDYDLHLWVIGKDDKDEK